MGVRVNELAMSGVFIVEMSGFPHLSKEDDGWGSILHNEPLIHEQCGWPLVFFSMPLIFLASLFFSACP